MKKLAYSFGSGLVKKCAVKTLDNLHRRLLAQEFRMAQ
jgi:hypothetical protein